MASTLSKRWTRSMISPPRALHQYKYGLYTQSIFFSTKKKKLPKKWKPTTTMFVPSKDHPGKYELSKHHNIKYMYDPLDGKEPDTNPDADSDDGPSIIQQIETALEEDVDEEETDDMRFLQNYRWIIVSLLGMVVVLMGGFCLGFTRIKYSDLNNDDTDKQKQKQKPNASQNIFYHYLSKLKADESVVKGRHQAIAQILMDLTTHASDCVLIDNDQRYKNKSERETKYLEMVESKQTTQNIDTVEQQLFDQVMDTKWTQMDLSDFDVDDIADEHWNLSNYINDIRSNDIRLQFLPPLDTMRYGVGKKKRLMWIYSKKHLEWFQVVMSFNTKAQRAQDLNFVAIRLRFKEFFCYPVLQDNGASDTTRWLIERKKYEPRIEHLRRLQRHKEYYTKKYYHGVDPSKYELDVDDGICEYYGSDIFEQKQNVEEETETKRLFETKKESEGKEIKDEELLKLVSSLEARIERRKLKEAAKLNEKSQQTPVT